MRVTTQFRLFFLFGDFMRASLYKVMTDHEGESTVIFKIPSSDIAEAVMLLKYLQTELILEAKPAPQPQPAALASQGEPEPSL